MKQSRLMSLVESVINIAVGLGVAMVANAIILPLVGFPISLAQNAIIAAFMTVISIARSFVLRRLFEALHIRHPLSPAMHAIIAERRRQIEIEGWDNDHDDRHERGELARAGAAYAVSAAGPKTFAFKSIWPWDEEWWKPRDFRRDLVRAGALIIAELDKFERSRKTRRRKETA